ncbi:MAG TPA: twin-arginine translocase TatA/TatE family subunit [Rubrobacter sp.]|nr:twin-arginine translocase TatA/TatE family subunit [Rubrobacter sp.]
MFGVGAPEMVVIGLLLLLVFGPKKLPSMARDIGRFVSEARRSVEEFKKDLVSEEEVGQEPRKGRGPEEHLELEARGKPEEGEAVAPSAQRSD